MIVRVFCYHCLSTYNRGVLQSTRWYETAFFVEGFKNWIKAVQHFHRHETAESHKEAALKLKALCASSQSVIEQLSSDTAKMRAENRKMLLTVLSSLRFLLRPGFAVRGHRETDGNLIQPLHLRSEDRPQLTK